MRILGRFLGRGNSVQRHRGKRLPGLFKVMWLERSKGMRAGQARCVCPCESACRACEVSWLRFYNCGKVT